MHIHVQHETDEAKFWMEPSIELAENHGMNEQRLREAKRVIEEPEHEIRTAWVKHFKR